MKHLFIFTSIATLSLVACKTEKSCTNYPSFQFIGSTIYVQPVGSAGFTDTHNWQQAIDYCNNLDFDGCDDWYLPSKDELHELYLNKNQIGDFSSVYYWSSTHAQSIDDKALKQDFHDGSGNPTTTYDYDNLRCQCVRK